jgi:hypothetical protein
MTNPRLAWPAALLAALLLLGAAPAPRAPAWVRSLPAGPPDADVQITIAGGTVAVVRTGVSVVGLDLATGKRRWTLANVTGFAAADDAVIVTRAGFVFAVRPADAIVLWRRACTPAPFLVAWKDRIATLCSGKVTILNADDGAVVAAQELPRAARGRQYHAEAIDETFFALSNDVALQTGFSVIDARTGALRWRKPNSQIVATGPTWIDLAPGTGLPVWAPAGTVERHDLATGQTIAKHVFTFSVPVDGHGTPLYASSVAMYAFAGNGELYHALLSEASMERLTPAGGAVTGPVILGGSAFYGTAATADALTSTVYVERLVGGKLTSAALGTFDNTAGLRAGDRVAFNAKGTVSLFDERGGAAGALRTGCIKIGSIVAAAKRYVVLCPTKTATTILGFPRF